MPLTALTEGKGAVAFTGARMGTVPGPWAAFTGGQLNVPITKISPGHMLPPISVQNPSDRDNVVIRRIYNGVAHDLKPQLDAAAERGEVFTVTRLYLDDANAVFGRGDSYSVKITRVTAPDYDSTSTNAAYLEIELVSDGPVGR